MYLSLLAKRSLRTQIALLFGVLVATIAVLGSLGFGEWIRYDGQRASGRALQLAAHNAAVLLAKGLHERGIETQVLANAQDVWAKGLNSAEARALLARVQARQVHTAWAGVADVHGTVLAATGQLLVDQSVAERPWFQQGLKRAFIGDVHKALLLERLLKRPPGSEPARFVDFAAPIHLQGQVVGVLGIHGSWEWTGETIESLMPPPNERAGLEVLVFDRNGELIYAPPTSLRALQSTGQRAPSLNADAAAQVVAWADGVQALSASVSLPEHGNAADLGWRVVARQPLAQAYARSAGVVQRALLVGLLVAGIAALLSWALARRLSEDLRTLARAARNVRVETHEAAIPLLGSNREVLELSSALSHMTASLIQANDEMDSQVRLRTRQLEDANRELDRQAHTDALTGLLNRRGLDDQFEFALALASRNVRPLSLICIDIDNFKRINDEHGHAAGDAVLQRLASLLAEHLRASDVVARVGGEEFVVLLPDTDTAGAKAVAEALLVVAAALEHPEVGNVTLSAGVASLHGAHEKRIELLARGDAALYKAKQTGRNRVCLAD